MGGPVSGSLTFVADMIMRTSFFFNASSPFEVTDWKEPAWQGEFEITVKGAGSDRKDGEKGGPPVEYTWSLDRYMIGRLHTPDWDEDNEAKRNYDTDARHKLEIDGESRHFKLTDSSSSKSKNSHNRYRADGPLQIPPPAGSTLASYSRAEPSGSAELMFTGGKMVLNLEPFFGAECLVHAVGAERRTFREPVRRGIPQPAGRRLAGYIHHHRGQRRQRGLRRGHENLRQALPWQPALRAGVRRGRHRQVPALEERSATEEQGAMNTVGGGFHTDACRRCGNRRSPNRACPLTLSQMQDRPLRRNACACCARSWLPRWSSSWRGWPTGR